MRSEFEKHYLSLEFYTEGSAQLCLDACTFDEKQDAYLPNIDWILENDEDECVVYCCMLNTAYISFKHQQSKVDELQKQKSLQELEINQIAHANQQWRLKCGELQKRVEKAERKLQLVQKCIEENSYSNMRSGGLVIQVAELEQALKGEEQ